MVSAPISVEVTARDGGSREPVTESAHGLDIGLIAGLREDSAQPLHIDIDRTLVDVTVVAPHLREKLCSIECSAGMRHQELEQPILRRLEPGARP